MTETEFKDVLKRLGSKCGHHVAYWLQGGISLGTAVHMLAEDLWVEQTPEDDDTAALRMQLRYMSGEPGHMVFDDEGK